MKAIALASILLLAACSSSSDAVTNTFECGPEQDLEIRAGLADPGAMREMSGQVTYLVEVANNSHQDLTVKAIRIEPRETGSRSQSRLQGARRSYDQTIPHGTEHVFELPATELSGGMNDRESFPERYSELMVYVMLTNGDSYRCPFRIARR